MTTHDDSLTPEKPELSKKNRYESQYNSALLIAKPRTTLRDNLKPGAKLPFYGLDIWNHYEVSWLDQKGKPIVALAEMTYDCTSPNFIESESLREYFNSFNNTKCKSVENAIAMMQRDLTERVGADVEVKIKLLSELKNIKVATHMLGTSIDDLEVECKEYKVNPELLSVDKGIVEETLCTDLLKSNCPVTLQPDWCSLQITYKGKRINRENLLKYIVSFRNQNQYHEQCIEQIFMDLMKHCKPQELTVYGRSTRRGGLDVNAYRSTQALDGKIENVRLARQ